MPYTIQKTAPTVYLDSTGDAVNGYKVTVYFQDFDETHFLNVPSLDPVTVQSAADTLLEQRTALHSLGSDTERKSK